MTDRGASSGNGDDDPGPPERRPTMADFEEWIRKRGIIAIAVVIIVAFLSKTFVPIQFGFSLGLAAGLAALVAAYLVDFYRREG